MFDQGLRLEVQQPSLEEMEEYISLGAMGFKTRWVHRDIVHLVSLQGKEEHHAGFQF